MQPEGTTTAWLQRDDGALEDVGHVKFSEELDRANFRFGDVDGKGEHRHWTPSPLACCLVDSQAGTLLIEFHK